MKHILKKCYEQGVVDSSVVMFNVLDQQTNDPSMHDKVVVIHLTNYTYGSSSEFRQAMSKQDARNVYSNLRKEGYFQEN